MTAQDERPIVVRARDLTKIYRLYEKPLYKFLDIFALCPPGERYYREHVAVEGLSLEVRQGEKVAVIGRNGAGKSTLLKIITGAIQPTSGTVEVTGKLSALLQIGTGYHPDFTGRENVLSMLAHLGITGADARAKFEEAVDFAELEEYIDQPMKTYSTGMTARLMFAASTVIEPDILVCDEVLGVGDSYFAHKSAERMKELSQNHGTTFILVTHDLYSALNVCTRFLWLERGKILRDADGKTTIAAYEHSIKEQEEARSHKKALVALAGRPRAARLGAASRNGSLPPGWSFRIRAAESHTLDAPLHVARLEAVFADGRREACQPLESASLSRAPVLGREALTLSPFGDIFHNLDAWLPEGDNRAVPVSLEVEYATDATRPIQVSASSDQTGFHVLGALPASAPGWRTVALPFPAEGLASLSSANQAFHRYGTGDVTLEAIRLLSPAGEPRVELHHGDALRIEVDYKIRNPALDRNVVVVIGLHRHGYLASTSFVRDTGALLSDQGTLVVDLDRVLLTNGDYNLAIGLLRPSVKNSTTYFTVSPEVLDMQPRAATLTVLDDPPFTSGFAFVHPIRWSEK
jgi:ABC-type polysaccharide/polyol phosphate transport system ATPase subunit